LSVNATQLNRQLFYVEGAMNRLAGALVFAVFLVCGVLLRNAGEILLGYLFWGFSLLALIWAVFRARGHPPG